MSYSRVATFRGRETPPAPEGYIWVVNDSTWAGLGKMSSGGGLIDTAEYALCLCFVRGELWYEVGAQLLSSGISSKDMEKLGDTSMATRFEWEELPAIMSRALALHRLGLVKQWRL